MRAPTQLKMHRRSHGHTQTSLAADLGVARQTINLIETGRTTPTLRLALRIAEALHSSVHEFWAPDGTLLDWNGVTPWDRVATW